MLLLTFKHAMRDNFLMSRYEEKHVNLGGLNRVSYVQVLFCSVCVCLCVYACVYMFPAYCIFLLYGNP